MDTPKGEYGLGSGICIGKAAKHFREEQKLTLEFVAVELGLDVSAYALLEADQISINDEMLKHLSQVLKVSITDLLIALSQNVVSDGGNAKESGEAELLQKQEHERLERLYREQINLLQEEVSYLRNILEALSNKS
jgi:transcriptional regulator with XRE-family HTH domain